MKVPRNAGFKLDMQLMEKFGEKIGCPRKVSLKFFKDEIASSIIYVTGPHAPKVTALTTTPLTPCCCHYSR